MLSNSQEKLLRKLANKKYRNQFELFIAEGRKVVEDLINAGLKYEFLMASSPLSFTTDAITVSKDQLNTFSQLETSDEVLGVFKYPTFLAEESSIVLILDEVRNPGNLGTIIRSCDWFGVKKIYCTKGTVDQYNAKTVQSTMGSIARVQVEYATSEEVLEELKEGGYQIYSADMQGVHYKEVRTESKKALVMGSESHGPSNFWKGNSLAVTIPKGSDSEIESLNVAVATSIILSNWS